MSARRVLVTGASRGIGRAIALALGRQGFELALNYRSQHDAAQSLADELRELGAAATLLPFDVGDRESSRKALEAELAERGPFWGAVHNAGIHADAA